MKAAAIYVRASTSDQEPENQLRELRQYVAARGCTATEFVDRGISGSKEKRPALGALLKDAKRRRFDVLVCWRLDRLGRDLKHLVTLMDELAAWGVSFVSLGEGIDCTTPAGKLQLHILAAWRSSSGNASESESWRACSGLRRKGSGSDDLAPVQPVWTCLEAP
jgi:DNA invertase Pin-like site-specific DNA recombinase